MKKLLCLLLIVFMGTGCSQLENPNDWERVTPTVQRISEIALLTAFSRDDIKEHKDEICYAVNQVADVLENIEDPTITFEGIRLIAINTVRESLNLEPELEQLVLLVVDQVLDVTFQYVETYYNDLLQEDKFKIVVMVTQAIADGFRNACGGLPEPSAITTQSVFP